MKRNIKWGIALIVIGLVLQLHALDIIEDITTYWPLLVVFVGIMMLFEQEHQSTTSTS